MSDRNDIWPTASPRHAGGPSVKIKWQRLLVVKISRQTAKISCQRTASFSWGCLPGRGPAVSVTRRRHAVTPPERERRRQARVRQRGEQSTASERRSTPATQAVPHAGHSTRPAPFNSAITRRRNRRSRRHDLARHAVEQNTASGCAARPQPVTAATAHPHSGPPGTLGHHYRLELQTPRKPGYGKGTDAGTGRRGTSFRSRRAGTAAAPPGRRCPRGTSCAWWPGTLRTPGQPISW